MPESKNVYQILKGVENHKIFIFPEAALKKDSVPAGSQPAPINM